MPSFDVVSEVDLQEITNAVDQTRREVDNRFDFKGSAAKIENTAATITLTGDNEFQIRQIEDILHRKLAKRKVDIGALDAGKIVESGSKAHQDVTVRQGIDPDIARKIVKLIKGAKLKVQATVQGEQVRINGKNRDDLQDAIALLKESNLGLPLQYINFRD